MAAGLDFKKLVTEALAETFFRQMTMSVPDLAEFVGDTELHVYAERGQVKNINKTVKKKPQLLEKINSEGRTALCIAAFWGQRNAVQALLKAGANVHFRDSEGINALHHAAQMGNQDIMTDLLAHGADINSMDDMKFSVLTYATQVGNTTSAAFIIGKGGNLEDKTVNGWSPLMSTMADEKGHLDTMKLLVKHGADVNSVDKKGYHVLWRAASIQRHDCVQFLLESGAEVNKTTSEGYTALTIATEQCDVKTVRALIAFGADVNHVDKDGDSILHIAVGMVENDKKKYPLIHTLEPKKSAIVRMLLEKGVNSTVRDKSGRTAGEKAAALKYGSIAKLLVVSSTGLDDVD